MAWYLTFHILGIIVWMGALLDLTRILGYHVKEELPVQARLSKMEFRIFFFVATPGLVITALFGIFTFLSAGGVAQYFSGGSGWFHLKLTLVILLMLIHGFVGKNILALKAKPEKMSPKRYKILHGVTALCVLVIIMLTFVKPF